MSRNAGMPLVLLESREAWDNFKNDLAVRYSIDVQDIEWDDESEPDSYPCLVSSVAVEHSLVFLFVYERDARNLLSAVAASPVRNTPSALPTFSSDGAWNRHMVSLVLTLVNEIVSVGITNQDRFESVLKDMLNIVEEKHTEDIDSVRQLVLEQFKKIKGDD